jgi:hypothetical protein
MHAAAAVALLQWQDTKQHVRMAALLQWQVLNLLHRVKDKQTCNNNSNNNSNSNSNSNNKARCIHARCCPALMQFENLALQSGSSQVQGLGLIPSSVLTDPYWPSSPHLTSPSGGCRP